MFHPWRFVGRFRHIRIKFQDLGGKVSGRSNGVDTIYLEERLDKVERRCTLTHELFHIAEGHRRRCGESDERRVRYMTARALVPFDRIVHCVLWKIPVDKMACELRVTDRVMADRIACITDEELRVLFVMEAHLYGEGLHEVGDCRVGRVQVAGADWAYLREAS